MVTAWRAAILAGAASCLPLPEAPEVELPAATGAIAARLSGRLPSPVAGGEIDARNLRRRGTLVLAASRSGLVAYDLGGPDGRLVSFLPEAAGDDVALAGDLAVIARIGARFLDVVDVSDPSAPRVVRRLASPTSIFGGLDARDDLVWHAPGSMPPSRLFWGGDPRDDRACAAPDRERGAMGVWLHGRLGFISVHFDDFAGDGFDGNGGYGVAVADVGEGATGCPVVRPVARILVGEHAYSRSRLERGGNSDIQVDYDEASGLLALTGGQRLEIHLLDASGRPSFAGTLDVPDAVDVALDPGGPLGLVAAVADGDVVFVDLRDPARPAVAAHLATPGEARAVLPAGDGRRFLVADGEAGIAVVTIERGAAP